MKICKQCFESLEFCSQTPKNTLFFNKYHLYEIYQVTFNKMSDVSEVQDV